MFIWGLAFIALICSALSLNASLDRLANKDEEQ